MPAPTTTLVIHGSYDPVLVALSILIATLASYVALDLAGRVTAARGRVRAWWLAGGAAAMGVGIWSMHFTGMLAFHLHRGATRGAEVAVAYDVPLLLTSVAIAVAASLLALAVASRATLGSVALATAGLSMGAAIAGMHYVGMASMRPGPTSYSEPLVLASIAIAVSASAAALWLAHRLRHAETAAGRRTRVGAAIVMGAAIYLMHYTAMVAARFDLPSTGPFAENDAVLATDGLAAVVVVSTLLVLGLALAGAVVDRLFRQKVADAERERQLRAEAEQLAAELQTQATELEQQTEEAQSLAEELEQANAELGRQYALLQTVLGSTDDLVFAKDLEGRYVVMNEAGARLHGRPVEEIVGRTDAEILPPALAAELRANDLAVLRSGEVLRFEESTAKDGEQRTYRSTKTVFRDPTGAVAGIVGVATDVTEAMRADADRSTLLEREHAARLEAERANRAKSEFLAVMSHELRTPLNAIAGYVQLLEMELHGPLTDAQRETLRRVDRSQRHLLALINDILNFVRIEAGRVHYELGEIDLATAVADLAPFIEPQLAEKGLAYAVRLADPPVVVRADPDKLRQILLNLLSNAIKFTPAGGRITVEVAEREGVPDAVFVRISDSGRGIPRDKLEVIFEPFVRVDTGLTRTTEGTGLGLAISRDLARGMGGDLTAESTPGVGSTFTLTLPAA